MGRLQLVRRAARARDVLADRQVAGIPVRVLDDEVALEQHVLAADQVLVEAGAPLDPAHAASPCLPDDRLILLGPVDHRGLSRRGRARRVLDDRGTSSTARGVGRLVEREDVRARVEMPVRAGRAAVRECLRLTRARHRAALELPVAARARVERLGLDGDELEPARGVGVEALVLQREVVRATSPRIRHLFVDVHGPARNRHRRAVGGAEVPAGVARRSRLPARLALDAQERERPAQRMVGVPLEGGLRVHRRDGQRRLALLLDRAQQAHRVLVVGERVDHAEQQSPVLGADGLVVEPIDRVRGELAVLRPRDGLAGEDSGDRTVPGGALKCEQLARARQRRASAQPRARRAGVARRRRTRRRARRLPGAAHHQRRAGVHCLTSAAIQRNRCGHALPTWPRFLPRLPSLSRSGAVKYSATDSARSSSGFLLP